MSSLKPYRVMCIQSCPKQVSTTPRRRDTDMMDNLNRILELIDFHMAFAREGVRLITLPEYSLNGVWQEIPMKEWLQVAVTLPNKCTELLSQRAKELNVYIAAHFLELHEDWPGRFFNTALLISPQGDFALKHWKNNNNSWILPYTTPSDIYDEFVERYGRQALFPVADTPLGKIGIITCGEIAYPENARCTCLNGAEVLVHMTAELMELWKWHYLRVARAIENKCYVLGTNVGAYLGCGMAAQQSQGGSSVIDFEGRELVQVPGAGEAVIKAVVDVNSVREARAVPFWPTTLRSQMFAREYAEAPGWPLNTWLHKPIEGTDETRKLFGQIVEERYQKGVYTRPARD
ncbi:MAG: hypothetical protein HYY96_09755 [Candidatus Tectomicrobia bacterium]|nr:hypothetical protein [Candidatus Tectomicrobia bacterium]